MISTEAGGIFLAVLSKPDSALVIVGHGSTASPDAGASTRAHAEVIRRRGIFAEVHAAFWKAEPRLAAVLERVECADIYLAPNFMSEGYFTRQAIPRALGLEGALSRQNVRCGAQTRVRTVRYCEPVGNHPRMAEVLLTRARETAPDVPPEQCSLLVVGHGTARDGNSGEAVRRQVRRVAEMGIYAEVLAAYMEEAPFIKDWATLAAQPNVIVAPFLIADGPHTVRDIPAMLGLSADRVFENPHRLQGRSLYYSGAVGAEPMVAEVILSQVAAFDEAFPDEL